jgi:hypothetical protein
MKLNRVVTTSAQTPSSGRKRGHHHNEPIRMKSAGDVRLAYRSAEAQGSRYVWCGRCTVAGSRGIDNRVMATDTPAPTARPQPSFVR